MSVTDRGKRIREAGDRDSFRHVEGNPFQQGSRIAVIFDCFAKNGGTATKGQLKRAVMEQARKKKGVVEQEAAVVKALDNAIPDWLSGGQRYNELAVREVGDGTGLSRKFVVTHVKPQSDRRQTWAAWCKANGHAS